MAKLLFLGCLFIWAMGLLRAEDAWFSAKLPINGKLYPVTARIHTEKVKDNLEFSSELHYRNADTTFSMHTTGLYNTVKDSPIWQNTIRDALFSVEWSFKDYTEKPAIVSWLSDQKKISATSFDNEALPEEFLYFLTEKIDSVNTSKNFKIFSPAWEVSFNPELWYIDARYTGRKERIQGVDCYQVLYTRADGAKAEYYITVKGKQVWRFQTFRGVWFDRVQ